MMTTTPSSSTITLRRFKNPKSQIKYIHIVILLGISVAILSLFLLIMYIYLKRKGQQRKGTMRISMKQSTSIKRKNIKTKQSCDLAMTPHGNKYGSDFKEDEITRLTPKGKKPFR